jgi:hypothetical protein
MGVLTGESVLRVRVLVVAIHSTFAELVTGDLDRERDAQPTSATENAR